MAKIVEMDRLIYSFENSEDMLLLVKESTDGVAVWEPLIKGWNYQLWMHVCSRGGLCEAEELLLLVDGKEKTVPIEDYVKLYREQVSNHQIPARSLFEMFDVKVTAWRLRKCESEYVIRSFEEKYGLDRISEDEDCIHYEKNISTIEDLKEIPVEWSGDDFAIHMYFTESKAAVA